MSWFVQRLSQDTFGILPDLTASRPAQVHNNFTARELRRRISQFVPVIVTADTSDLTKSEIEVLGLLIEASKYLEPVFNRQSFRRYNQTREELVRQKRSHQIMDLGLMTSDINSGLGASWLELNWNILT